MLTIDCQRRGMRDHYPREGSEKIQLCFGGLCLTKNRNLWLFLIFVSVFVQSVEGENHEKAVELLKQAQGSVKLVVRYTPKVLEEMEMRFDKQRAARRRQFQ